MTLREHLRKLPKTTSEVVRAYAQTKAGGFLDSPRSLNACEDIVEEAIAWDKNILEGK